MIDFAALKARNEAKRAVSAATCLIDFETRSAVDLTKAGVYPYAEHPSTSILCMSWRVGDTPAALWVPGQEFPLALATHVAKGGKVVVHNAGFERAIWNAKLAPLGLPRLEIDQQDCTMARAAAMGLPQALHALGTALQIKMPKDVDGHRLMMSMCKPSGEQANGSPTWNDSPELRQRLGAYCVRDNDAEWEVHGRVPGLSARERAVWVLDQRINDRGVAVDLPLVRKAQAVAELAKAQADQQMWRLTGGAIKTCNQAAAIVAWINARGIPCTSVADQHTEELIVGSQIFDDPVAEQVIELRRATAKAFKFPAMLTTACRDGRVRGSLAYHGAHTGRWAGRGMQPQNFKRVENEEDADSVQMALEALQQPWGAQATLEYLDMVVGQPLEVLSIMARCMIIAPPGRKIVSGDFSGIESCVAAWVAGETWKIKALRDQHLGGPDLYKVMAGRVLGKPVEAITKQERQLQGKVPELSCNYQGALKALQKMAQKAKTKISDGTAMTLVRGWRADNENIVASWYELQDAAIEAVSAPGCVVTCLAGRVAYVMKNGFLLCRLPSGRVISYASATVAWKKKVVTIDGEEVELNKRGVSYWGMHMGRWMKLDLYGGSQFNHVVQGTARDLMVEAMFRVEAARYPLTLTIHDELLAEVDEDFGSADEFEDLMSVLPVWAEGLPLATKAWEDTRYIK